MDNFHRTYYEGMQMDICKTITVGKLVFLSGTEAMDAEKGGEVVEDLSKQIEVVVKKMNSGDPIAVIQKFHEECYRYAPGLREKPSTGTLAIVEGLAVDTFKVEVDAIAAYPD